MITLPESPLERAKRLHRPLVDIDTILGLEREPANRSTLENARDAIEGLLGTLKVRGVL